MSWRIGVDIGGTFTDVALIDDRTGRIGVIKLLSTPDDFGAAVIAGLQEALAENGVEPDHVSLLSHATTVVTNALLQNRGARAGLVTTRGFRDIIELRRSSRADLYDLFQDAPAVLIPRRYRFEITERVGADRQIVTPMAEQELPDLIAAIRRADLQSVAICLLFSFLNDRHERRIADAIKAALPDIAVYLSADVLPEIREFERASTTAVCAAVAPVLASYLQRLTSATRAMGLPTLHVMTSSGGMVDASEALRMPAMVVESGPAAGVVAAALAGRQLGRANLISFDMGGTTAKASVIRNGNVAVTAEYEVGGGGHGKRWMHGTGHPIRVPVIDLAEVSAGGGSVAWVDPGGALKVGPHSAGASPGPAAYGGGGVLPTVTDADIVLGWLNRSALLGGQLKLHASQAELAIARHIADPLRLSVPEAAARIAQVVNATMAQALRIVSVERGYDPAEFSLIAFGGAGPVHAAFLAAELAIPEVIVPPAPGAFSALGLVAGEIRRDWSRTLYASLANLDPTSLAETLSLMERAAQAFLDDAEVPEPQRALIRQADLRYGRQAYELTIAMAPGPVAPTTIEQLAAHFHQEHERTYGHANRAEPVHLVNLRLTAVGRLPEIAFAAPGDADLVRSAVREAWFPDTGFIRTQVLWRPGLRSGSSLAGPAVIEAMDSTTIVPPGWVAAVDDRGTIRLTRSG
jgi:N-methylhydantoinase A